MRRLVLTAVATLIGSAAVGQGVPVLSGEHGTFTRVSIPITLGAKWDLERSNSGYDVRITPMRDLDLSDVFRRISKSRIENIKLNPSGLDVELNCDCDATAFLFRSQYLVIDIANHNSDKEIGVEPISIRSEGFQRRQNMPAQENQKLRLPLIESGPPTVNLSLETPSSDLQIMERQLVETILQEADIDRFDIDPGIQAKLEKSDRATESNTNELEQTNPTLGATPGLALQVSTNSIQVSQPKTDTEICWPQKYTDPALWVGDNAIDFSKIALLKSNLTNDVGHIDASINLVLAQAYLRLGFGLEAAAILRLDPTQSQEELILLEIANILDGTKEDSTFFQSQTGCTGTVSIWNILTNPSNEKMDKDGADDIVRAFKLLPNTMKRPIASRLVLSLVEADQQRLVPAIVQYLKELDISRNELILLEIRVHLAGGETDEALKKLDILLNESADLPVDLLVRLTEATLIQEVAPSPDLIRNLEERLYRNRDTVSYNAIMRSLAKSYIIASRFTEAIDLIRGENNYAAMRDETAALLIAITDEADDPQFLRFAFDDIAQVGNAKAENAVAQRLIDLGFPDRALDLMAGRATGAPMGERRYLRARALMVKGATELAEQELSGLTNPRAIAILKGLDWSDDSDPNTMEPRLAWREGDWPALAGSEEKVLNTIAALETQPTPSLSPDEPLGAGRVLIEDSERIRKDLDFLLAEFPAPQP